MTKKWEIQTLMLFGGWVNCWTTIDENGNETVEMFNSYVEAKLALEEYFQECDESVQEGYMDDMVDKDEYRIMEVK